MPHILILILILFLFVFLLSCESKSTNGSKFHEKQPTEKYNPERIDIVYLGDIEENGTLDSAFVFTPQTNLALDEHGDIFFLDLKFVLCKVLVALRSDTCLTHNYLRPSRTWN